MNVRLWIAGSLLIPMAFQSVRSEPQRPLREVLSETSASQQRRQSGEEAQAQRERDPARSAGPMSAEDRIKLRQDVTNAGRSIYPRQRLIPAHR